jgi:hypothetical protein
MGLRTTKFSNIVQGMTCLKCFAYVDIKQNHRRTHKLSRISYRKVKLFIVFVHALIDIPLLRSSSSSNINGREFCFLCSWWSLCEICALRTAIHLREVRIARILPVLEKWLVCLAAINGADTVSCTSISFSVCSYSQASSQLLVRGLRYRLLYKHQNLNWYHWCSVRVAGGVRLLVHVRSDGTVHGPSGRQLQQVQSGCLLIILHSAWSLIPEIS